jgi:hypothetical protein
MAYWVHGRDAKTGEPGSMLSTAISVDGAREQAASQGLIAETIQEETNPNTETVPLPVINPHLKRILRLRLKWIGIFLFVSAIVGGLLILKAGEGGVSHYYATGFMMQLMLLSFIVYSVGCIFQSPTWKSFELGCGFGLVMAVFGFFLLFFLMLLYSR